MAHKKKRSQPVSVKQVIHTIQAMLPRHTQPENGCICTHGSHRGGRCNAPTHGSINVKCNRFNKNHARHEHHNDAPIVTKTQRTKRHWKLVVTRWRPHFFWGLQPFNFLVAMGIKINSSYLLLILYFRVFPYTHFDTFVFINAFSEDVKPYGFTDSIQAFMRNIYF